MQQESLVNDNEQTSVSIELHYSMELNAELVLLLVGIDDIEQDTKT